MVNIRQVADKAGVSIATVSRVINKSGSVSQDTKNRVEEVIEELEYKPNLLGRNLRRAETRMILVSLNNIANPFYSRIVKGIEEHGKEKGYNIMIYNNNGDSEREKIYLNLLLNRLVDGVILLSPKISANQLSEIGKNYSVVQCCEYKKGVNIPRVSVDNVEAARTAVSYLINNGHRHIAMISGYKDVLSAVQREEGYRLAMEEAGLGWDENMIINGDYTYKGGEKAAREFISMKKKPTAIFAISDNMAVGAVKAIKEEGLKIPEDIAVVGFDNTQIASVYDPRITTISQPRYKLGEIAVDLLIKIIKGEKLEKNEYYLDHELIIRESSI